MSYCYIKVVCMKLLVVLLDIMEAFALNWKMAKSGQGKETSKQEKKSMKNWRSCSDASTTC